MEFLVDEARLVDLEGATSDAAPGCCCRLFGASSSLRGDGALDWSPGVDERASPCLESAMAGQTDLVQETGPGTARKPLTSRRGRSPGRIAREKARQVGISRQHEQAHGRIHAKVDSSGPQKQRDEGSGTGGWMQPMAKPGNVSRCDGAEGGVWGETVKKEAVVEGIGRWRGRDRLAVVWV